MITTAFKNSLYTSSIPDQLLPGNPCQGLARSDRIGDGPRGTATVTATAIAI